MAMLAFIDDPMSVVLALAAMMIVGWVMLRRSLRRPRRQEGHPSSSSNAMPLQGSGSRSFSGGDSEALTRWTVEMHQTARDLSGQLDSKMSALQALIQMSQAEQAKLQALIDKAEELSKEKSNE